MKQSFLGKHILFSIYKIPCSNPALPKVFFQKQPNYYVPKNLKSKIKLRLPLFDFASLKIAKESMRK